MKQKPIIRIIYFCLISLLFFSGCRNRGDEDRDVSAAVPGPESAEGLKPGSAAESMGPRIVFTQGEVYLNGTEGLPSLSGAEEGGFALAPGDVVSTGPEGSAEIVIGDFGTLRLLPSSVLSGFLTGQGGEGRLAEVFLEQGAVLAKVRKNGGDSFLVRTPNSLSLVRGTRFLVSYDGEVESAGAYTRVAVEDGRVSVLPRTAKMEELIGSRDEDAASALALSAAFSLGPSVEGGKELLIGNESEEENRKRNAEADAVYGLLEDAAGRLAGESGTSLNTADAAEILAPPESELRRTIEESLRRYGPASFDPAVEGLFGYMDHVREPGADFSVLPAALPGEFFPAYRDRPRLSPAEGSVSPSSGETANPYPAVLWNISLGSSAPVLDLVRAGAVLAALDGEGVSFGVDDTGKVLWRYGDDGVALNALNRDIALTGKKALTILDGGNGTSKGSWTFDGWAALPGTKGINVSDGVAMATPRGVAILRQGNAQLLREILVPGGIVSPLVLAGPDLAGISGNGSLVIMDTAAGRVKVEVIAGLGGDILPPAYDGGAIYAANRSGRVLAVDAGTGDILWERMLPAGIKAEPEIDSSRLYLWLGDNTLLRIRRNDGGDEGSPIAGVESAPLLAAGRLYWGGPGGTLVSADPVSGRILKTNAIPDAGSVRPLLVGGNLYIGTSGGRMIKMNASYL